MTLSIILSKQEQSIQLSIGEVKVGMSHPAQTFAAAPELKEGKTYISDEILQMLLMN